MGRATPGLMVLGGVRQLAEEAMGSKPISLWSMEGLRAGPQMVAFESEVFGMTLMAESA